MLIDLRNVNNTITPMGHQIPNREAVVLTMAPTKEAHLERL